LKITPLNVANVINMLAATFQITSITSIRSITLLEIEVSNEIVNILNNFQNTCSVSVLHS